MTSMSTSSSDGSSNFEAVVDYFRSLDSTEARRLKLSVQRLCILYCLYKQATSGCCPDRSPSEDATYIQRMLHRGWAGFRSMDEETAKEYFIKLLEVVNPSWYSKPLGLDMDHVTDVNTHDSEVIKPADDGMHEIRIDTCDRWIKVDIKGGRPRPRQQHGAIVAYGNMLVYGGKCEDRIFNDVQACDLKSFKWSKVDTVPRWTRGLGIAGHLMCAWQNSIFFVTGYSENLTDTVTVIEYDLLSYRWQKLKTRGRAPRARMGQSVMVVGDSLIIFGGEVGGDKSNAIDILLMPSWRWYTPKISGRTPYPRSRHISACHGDQYLLIFGGESDKGLLSDLHFLDTFEWKWLPIQTKDETPRELSCQAGLIIGSNLFIIGVTPKTGDSQTFMLDLSTLYWKLVTQSKGPSTFAKRGLSLVSNPYPRNEFLVAFGGSNDSCSNEVHVLRPSYGQVTDCEISRTRVNDCHLQSTTISCRQCQTDIEACEVLTDEDISIPELGDLFTLFTPEKVLEAIRRDGENHEHGKELSLPAGMSPEFKKAFGECSPSSGDVQDVFMLLFAAVKDQFQMTESTNNNVS